MFSIKLGKCSFYVVSQRTAAKPTRLYFARAVSLFCSLTLLFGGVLHDFVVVVCLNSLFTFLSENALTMEARPPAEADFYDAFQKFKHAFNLLVSLVFCRMECFRMFQLEHPFSK